MTEGVNLSTEAGKQEFQAAAKMIFEQQFRGNGSSSDFNSTDSRPGKKSKRTHETLVFKQLSRWGGAAGSMMALLVRTSPVPVGGAGTQETGSTTASLVGSHLHLCHGCIQSCRSLCAFELAGFFPGVAVRVVQSALFGAKKSKKKPQAANICCHATSHLSVLLVLLRPCWLLF